MRRHGVRALLALLLIGSADAEVLGVRGSTNQIEFYGVETNTSLVNPMPSPCCGIAVGASARDAAGNTAQEQNARPVVVDLSKPSARIVDIETPVATGPQ